MEHRRAHWLLGVAISASVQAAPQPAAPAPLVRSFAEGALATATRLAAVNEADEITSFRAALLRSDAEEAARIADRLIDARRPSGSVLKTDPLLNAVVGMLLVENGSVRDGRTYLAQATPSELPEGLRADSLFALAHAQEMLGTWREAASTLNLVAAERLSLDEQRRRLYALGRLALVETPDRAPAIIAPALAAATRPQDRWEGEFIVGAAHALTGNLPAAQAAGDRAWAAAAHAPTRDHAPMRAALLRASTSANRDGRIAMLSVAAAGTHQVNSGLASLLPLCDAAVAPADYVTFAAFAGFRGTLYAIPVRASRPAVVAAFQEALAGRSLFSGDVPSPGGSLMTLRCRTLVASNYDVAPPPIRPWEEWFARNGLYFAMSADFDDEAINSLSAKLIELEAKYGVKSPRLLPVIYDLGMRLSMRGPTSSEVELSRLRQLRSRSFEIMRAAGAPASFLPTESELTLERAISGGDDQARAIAGMRKLTAAKIERMPLTVAYSDAAAWLGADAELPLAEKRRVIDLLLTRFADRPGDLRRRALLVRLAELDRFEGKTVDAVRRMKAAGAKGGHCSAMLEPPKPQLVTFFSHKDFPTDLNRIDLEGSNAFEVDLGADGRINSHRILLSTPADLFDDAVTRVLATYKPDPATGGANAAACSALVSSVRWQLAEEDEAPLSSDFIPAADQGPSA